MKSTTNKQQDNNDQHEITMQIPDFLYREIQKAAAARGPECTEDVICRIALYQLFGIKD